MMEWLWMGIFGGLALVFAGAALWFRRKKQRLYREVDRMMDRILDNKKIEQTDLSEGEVSALAGKARRIQEKLEAEVGGAQREKEQVKSLISNMSHQLKTPLANIMMYEEILEDGSLPREEQENFLGKMKKQSVKVEWILNSLFKMVKLEQNVIVFEAEGALIRRTLLDAVNLVYEKAQRKGIEIETEYFPDCFLYHNPKWTTEVFANILENAVKYTPESGRITIGMRRYEMYSEIWFQDTGMGITKEELTKIFQRFYRSKDAENMDGSGIGLYLSKLILEKEKGYMNVASEHGKGSCFSVFLQNCGN